jgi:hypothetical protein
MDRHRTSRMRARNRIGILIAGVLASALAGATSENESIVYRPLGNMWPCKEPFTLSIPATGPAVFRGANCLCESGVREIRIDQSVVESWFARLVGSQFMTLPYNISPGPEDASRYELEMVTKSGSNRINFSRSSPRIPREVFQVFLEIERHVDYPGWVRFWGRDCGPTKPIQGIHLDMKPNLAVENDALRASLARAFHRGS